MSEQWRKSTYSGGSDNNNCVEVDDARPGSVRDSKDPEGPRLRFSPDAWQSFVTAVRDGEFGTA
ncbi:DUF397 domain-containing protein [Streptomyces sp. NRRL WC-3742]|uniref:DUF397 domain-containing protein n=1 Tax=Streptomyces sp. NRRL WC-3742 TaxID=1463934 RepID=UPI0004C76CE7|nr:DUF397 domain-containing protein [Streptomyces sp. NRRL WC-3742]